MHDTPASRGTRLVAMAAAAIGASAAGLLLTGAPADAAGPLPAHAPLPAHVKIDGSATAGTTSTIALRVPTESDTASTVSLKVDVPADALITSVTPQSKPGWDVEIVRTDLNPPVTHGDVQVKSDVTGIIWTATAGGIPPGQFDTFTVRIGVPDAGTLTLPAHQGYSDGTTVDWADAVGADGAEPAHPAPAIEVAAAGGAGDGAGDSGSGTPGAGSGTAGDSEGGSTSDLGGDTTNNQAADPALAIGLVGLAVGALGLVVAVVALVLTRRPRA